MKKIMIVSAVALAALFASCSQVKSVADINVDIPYSLQESIPLIPGDTAGIPLPPGGATLPFPAFPVATNSQQYIASYGTAVSKIEDVDLKSLGLLIVSPATQNFDFLDSVQVYISAPSQPEMLVAYEYGIPKGQNSLNLITETSVNLKNYFVQDTIYFRLSTHINAVPATGTQLGAAVVLHMLANPLN